MGHRSAELSRQLFEVVARKFSRDFERQRVFFDAFQRRVNERQSYGIFLLALNSLRPRPDFVLTECTFSGIFGGNRRIDYVIGVDGVVLLIELKVVGASAREGSEEKPFRRLLASWDEKASGVKNQLNDIDLADPRLKAICRQIGASSVCTMPFVIVQFSNSSKDEKKLSAFSAGDRRALKERHEVVQRKFRCKLGGLKILKDPNAVTLARREHVLRSTKGFGFYANFKVRRLSRI